MYAGGAGGGHVLTIFQPRGGELTTPKQHRKSDEKEMPAENLIKKDSAGTDAVGSVTSFFVWLLGYFGKH